MAEYIERSDAKEELLSWARCIKHPEHLMTEDAMCVLDGIPAADVVEVVHGRWHIDKSFIPFVCTCTNPKCGASYDIDGAFEWKFCPNCGARMDGE